MFLSLFSIPKPLTCQAGDVGCQRCCLRRPDTTADTGIEGSAQMALAECMNWFITLGSGCYWSLLEPLRMWTFFQGPRFQAGECWQSENMTSCLIWGSLLWHGVFVCVCSLWSKLIIDRLLCALQVQKQHLDKKTVQHSAGASQLFHIFSFLVLQFNKSWKPLFISVLSETF